MRWTTKRTAMWVALALVAYVAVQGWRHRAKQLDDPMDED